MTGLIQSKNIPKSNYTFLSLHFLDQVQNQYVIFVRPIYTIDGIYPSWLHWDDKNVYGSLLLVQYLVFRDQSLMLSVFSVENLAWQHRCSGELPKYHPGCPWVTGDNLLLPNTRQHSGDISDPLRRIIVRSRKVAVAMPRNRCHWNCSELRCFSVVWFYYCEDTSYEPTMML